ncbi:CPBP family intramembrane glutamic endopeptidase [Flaviflexus equikiangi]|uniref:CPBP family intramembrane metalloprotease n=1 Tax=Flaviflexus equikiangi TaxID=2758573 RepID=A0ABS2TF01_9ACTO|nr:CPBP family intramembrane glutamic endopeptidase [Flaviflexus equikiangi]MBM9432116.1 CPBP family intramembrane metalloprotease [Flaviflexus equikiangi]
MTALLDMHEAPVVGRSRAREAGTVLAVIALLAGLNALAHFSPLSVWFFTVPAGVAVILAIGRARGLTWAEIGLSPRYVKKGLAYGGIAAGVVAAGVIAGVLLPFTRDFFLDEGYASARKALLAAFVLIPIQTVLPEELAFRGILHSSLRRLGGMKTVFVAGSLLFGLWHVASSLSLTAGNEGLTAALGSGTGAQWAGIGLAVLATSLAGVAFTWLRHRSNSIIAPIGLHWAFNAFGALAAAAVFRM